MSIDERRYIEAILPLLFDEMISEYAATLPADSHHKPTARTVKQIVLQLADRQKYSPLHRQDCANTTLQQLSDYCCVKPSSISDALRCLEHLGIVKTIRKGGGINKLATVRNVDLSAFTQWGAPPFEPNKRKKQKPEHNGEFQEQHGELGEHNGDLDDQRGQPPQTLNELLNKETNGARATAEPIEQIFETDPYTSLNDHQTSATNETSIENTCSPERAWAMAQWRKIYKDFENK